MRKQSQSQDWYTEIPILVSIQPQAGVVFFTAKARGQLA